MSSPPEHSARDFESAEKPSRSFVARALTVVGLVVLAILVLATIWHAPDVFLVIFAGVLLGVFLYSLSETLCRWLPLRYGWCLTLVTLVVFGSFLGLMVYLVPQIVDRVSALGTQLGDALTQLRERVAAAPSGEQLLKYLPTFEELEAGRSRWVPAMGTMVQSTFGVLVNIVVIFFVGLYTAADPEVYRQGIIKLFPPPRRTHIAQVLSRVRITLWRWILGRLFEMTVIGVATAIGLWLLGIPLAVTMGVIAGLLTFIPNIGPVLSVIPPLLLALSQGPMMGVYVILLYTGLQFVESYLLTPMVQQHQVSLPPALVIAVQVLMGVLAGLLGIALATPLAAAVLVLVQDLYVQDVLHDDVEMVSDK
ncbi:AI-2E family transporter [Candidatus Laterigemmans baculatus]|uniref:AI-2E family transporter n=1 Tax=Candidatus Laterigemmans baculatus TaxID=2770505 RepID=UPI0013DC8886|nr:AI-2E family transporter [Candidatus Laterigemmans baculatus]